MELSLMVNCILRDFYAISISNLKKERENNLLSVLNGHVISCKLVLVV